MSENEIIENDDKCCNTQIAAESSSKWTANIYRDGEFLIPSATIEVNSLNDLFSRAIPDQKVA